MIGAAARQKQLARFKILKIFSRLELPRSRQDCAQNRASNLARGCEVAIERSAFLGGWLAAFGRATLLRSRRSSANPFKKLLGRFVVAPLCGGEGVFGGDELAAEGFGEDGLGESVDVAASQLVAGFEFVGDGEESVDAADDFLLLGERWKRHVQIG
jgi:hypothetical protein